MIHNRTDAMKHTIMAAIAISPMSYSALAQNAQISIDVDKAVLLARGAAVRVSATVTCTLPVGYTNSSFSVTLYQPNNFKGQKTVNQAGGGALFACNGIPEKVTADATSVFGLAFSIKPV